MMFEFIVDDENGGITVSDVLRGWCTRPRGVEVPSFEEGTRYEQGAIGNLSVFTVRDRLHFFVPTGLPEAHFSCSFIDKITGQPVTLNGKYPCLISGHAGNTHTLRVIA